MKKIVTKKRKKTQDGGEDGVCTSVEFQVKNREN